MADESKDKTITFRLDIDLYNKCISTAIKQSTETGRMVKISEIIREAIEKQLK